MNQKDQVITQLDMLEKCLVCKQELLKKIYQVTLDQEAILDTEPVSEEAFENTLSEKEELLKLLEQYDQGFENTFEYRARIETMQQLIKTLTDQGVRIQALEQKNKRKLDIYLDSQRQQIKTFNVSNRTVSNYYKSISGASKGESYYMDKKR